MNVKNKNNSSNFMKKAKNIRIIDNENKKMNE